jgi:hypothetical protein
VKLIAAQKSMTVQSFGGRVYLDPGIYVASLRSALVFDVARASYAKPITVRQVVRVPGHGTRIRRLPRSVLDGFNGFKDFLRLRVTNSSGKAALTRTIPFCPNGFAERTNPSSQTTSPYPLECVGFTPFQKAIVWGIARGWAIDQPLGNAEGRGYKLPVGTYKVTETVTRTYRRFLHIAAGDATSAVTIKVVKGQGCCGVAGSRRPGPRHGTLPSMPKVPIMLHPPRSALPDLVPTPSFSISTEHVRANKIRSARDLLNFAATVWVNGSAPLDVEGFRTNGSPIMKAYQYFSRDGHIVGRARVGSMGFAEYNNWHFRQFAQYRLLDSARKLAVPSHKEGFCIAPTDPINLLLKNATWVPSFTGLDGACGDPSTLWVAETMQVGWGDTYEQSVPGESFNITKLPNGTYYIEVIANPLKLLHESNTRNDVSLRKVILGGTPGHRTVKVPAFDGIDPEG